MQEKFIQLTVDNVLFTNLEFGKQIVYHGNEMNFLKKPLIYTFEEPVLLCRAPYGILMAEISEKDITFLNLFFVRMHPKIAIKPQLFINYAETVKFEHRKKYKIQVEIKGYKRNQDKTEKEPSPIWKITIVS